MDISHAFATPRGRRMTGSASQAMDVIVLLSVATPEERSGEEIHVAVAPDTRLADDGKRLPGDGRCSLVRQFKQRKVKEGDNTQGFCPIRGWRIAPICYIYIRKLNFLGSLFWTYFGEVLERFWRGSGRWKSLKNHWFLQVFQLKPFKNHWFLQVFKKSCKNHDFAWEG